MNKLALITIVLLTAGSFQTYSQDGTITGTVLSTEDESPIPGVSIVVKGTETGTVTNLKGEFTINLPEDKRFLVIYFVGMITKVVEIAGQEHIIISMSPDIVECPEVTIIYDTLSGMTSCIPGIPEQDQEQ